MVSFIYGYPETVEFVLTLTCPRDIKCLRRCAASSSDLAWDFGRDEASDAGFDYPGLVRGRRVHRVQPRLFGDSVRRLLVKIKKPGEQCSLQQLEEACSKRVCAQSLALQPVRSSSLSGLVKSKLL